MDTSLFKRRRGTLILTVLVGALMALAFAVTMGAATQSAQAKTRHHARHAVHRAHARTADASTTPNANGPADSSEGTSGSSEGDSNDAAQAAACTAAGIDPNASNVQYDDQTGTCSLDSGANNGGTDNGGTGGGQ